MNEALFNQIYDQYYKRVYNYISYRINNNYDVEDLVSQVFSKTLEKYDTYDSKKGVFEAWIIRIARNTLNDYFRHNQKHPTTSVIVFLKSQLTINYQKKL